MNTHENKDHDHGGSQNIVEVFCNGTRFKIHRGSQTGLELRQAFGCPSTYSLKLLPSMQEVSVSERVTIKGGEKFACHEPMGQAS